MPTSVLSLSIVLSMNTIIIGLLVSVLAVPGELQVTTFTAIHRQQEYSTKFLILLQHCVAPDQQDAQCAGYCFEVTKPLLDHTKMLYTQEEASNNSREPEYVEELLQAKLKNLKAEIDSVLQQQNDANAATKADILARFKKIEVQLKKVPTNGSVSTTTNP